MSRKPENTYRYDEDELFVPDDHKYAGGGIYKGRANEIERRLYQYERDVEFINDWTRRISEYNY